MTPETLAAATGCTLLRAATYAPALTAAMKRWGIDTPLRQAAFLAQVATESGRLSVLTENLNYRAATLMKVWPSRFPTLSVANTYVGKPQALANKVYGGRMGNTAPGDGWKYRGRGFIQLTGKDNYKAYSKGADVDAVNNPDLLLDAHYAADSAGWYWHTAGCNASADKRDWAGLTRKINGGQLGLAERIALTAKACAALGVK